MSRIESAIICSSLGLLVPFCLFFAAWWLGVGFVPERLVPAAAFSGLGAGILLDLLFLRKWAARAYRMPYPPLMFLFICVSVITYALFMGSCVLNIVPGVIAGAYAGRRCLHSGNSRARSKAHIARAGLFVASVIACAASVSAFLALREPFLGMELERTFDLNFTVTRSMIVGLVAVGGPALVAIQYLLATKAAWIAFGRGGNVEADAR